MLQLFGLRHIFPNFRFPITVTRPKMIFFNFRATAQSCINPLMHAFYKKVLHT